MEAVKTMEPPCFFDNGSYMNEKQLAYFKNKLMWLKRDVLEKVEQSKKNLKTMGSAHPDILDRSNLQSDIEQQLWVQERNVLLARQIDAALDRIEDGSFGYCLITGDEIGLKRLEALPFTSLSIHGLEEVE